MHTNRDQQLTIVQCDCGRDLWPQLINTTGFDGKTAWVLTWHCLNHGQPATTESGTNRVG